MVVDEDDDEKRDEIRDADVDEQNVAADVPNSEQGEKIFPGLIVDFGLSDVDGEQHHARDGGD